MMAEVFRVWVHVEAYDDETDTERDVELPVGAVGVFGDAYEAITLALSMQVYGERAVASRNNRHGKKVI